LAPVPCSEDRFSRLSRCGPQSGFTVTLAWPGTNHSLSGPNVRSRCPCDT